MNFSAWRYYVDYRLPDPFSEYCIIWTGPNSAFDVPFWGMNWAKICNVPYIVLYDDLMKKLDINSMHIVCMDINSICHIKINEGFKTNKFSPTKLIRTALTILSDKEVQNKFLAAKLK